MLGIVLAVTQLLKVSSHMILFTVIVDSVALVVALEPDGLTVAIQIIGFHLSNGKMWVAEYYTLLMNCRLPRVHEVSAVCPPTSLLVLTRRELPDRCGVYLGLA